jgi:hypothetical protein
MTLKTRDLSDLEFLNAVATHTVRDLPYPPKLVESKLNNLLKRGLIDYGVNIWAAFLTDEGKAELEAANAKGNT